MSDRERDRTIARVAPPGTRLLADELLTEAVTLQLIHWIGMGVSIDMACRFSGISSTKFRRWMRKGEDQEDEDGSITEPATEPYASFAARIREAEATLVSTVAESWVTADDWRAKAKFLAARYPEEYSERRIQRPESIGPSTINVTITPREDAYDSKYDPEYDPEAADVDSMGGTAT